MPWGILPVHPHMGYSACAPSQTISQQWRPESEPHLQLPTGTFAQIGHMRRQLLQGWPHNVMEVPTQLYNEFFSHCEPGFLQEAAP